MAPVPRATRLSHEANANVEVNRGSLDGYNLKRFLRQQRRREDRVIEISKMSNLELNGYFGRDRGEL